MRYRLLGPSGLRVSELGLGTMTFGTDWGWGADEAECGRILERYRQAGGNFVDTSSNYTDGSSERIVGELTKGARERCCVFSTSGEANPRVAINAIPSVRVNFSSCASRSRDSGKFAKARRPCSHRMTTSGYANTRNVLRAASRKYRAALTESRPASKSSARSAAIARDRSAESSARIRPSAALQSARREGPSDSYSTVW